MDALANSMILYAKRMATMISEMLAFDECPCELSDFSCQDDAKEDIWNARFWWMPLQIHFFLISKMPEFDERPCKFKDFWCQYYRRNAKKRMNALAHSMIFYAKMMSKRISEMLDFDECPCEVKDFWCQDDVRNSWNYWMSLRIQ